jgi:hypothetical protein
MAAVLNPQPWLDALTHGNDEERNSATLAIGGFSLDANIDVFPLIDALCSTDEKLVFWSVIGLGRAESQAAQAISSLASLVQSHPAFGIRQAAVAALRKIAPLDTVARQATTQALQDSSAFVRREALQSFAAYPSLSPAEIQVVTSLAADPDESVVSWSEIALRHHKVAQ